MKFPPSGVRRTEFMVFNLRGELETLDNNKLKQMTSSSSAHRLHQLRETSLLEEKQGQPFEIRKSCKEFRSPVSEEIWIKGTVVYSNSLLLNGADNCTLNPVIEKTTEWMLGETPRKSCINGLKWTRTQYGDILTLRKLGLRFTVHLCTSKNEAGSAQLLF